MLKSKQDWVSAKKSIVSKSVFSAALLFFTYFEPSPVPTLPIELFNCFLSRPIKRHFNEGVAQRLASFPISADVHVVHLAEILEQLLEVRFFGFLVEIRHENGHSSSSSCLSVICSNIFSISLSRKRTQRALKRTQVMRSSLSQ